MKETIGICSRCGERGVKTILFSEKGLLALEKMLKGVNDPLLSLECTEDYPTYVCLHCMNVWKVGVPDQEMEVDGVVCSVEKDDAIDQKTAVCCRVCGGEVVEDVVKEYDPATGPKIFGPGSRDQLRKVSKGFYCRQCGLKYQFLPPPK